MRHTGGPRPPLRGRVEARIRIEASCSTDGRGGIVAAGSLRLPVRMAVAIALQRQGSDQVGPADYTDKPAVAYDRHALDMISQQPIGDLLRGRGLTGSDDGL